MCRGRVNKTNEICIRGGSSSKYLLLSSQIVDSIENQEPSRIQVARIIIEEKRRGKEGKGKSVAPDFLHRYCESIEGRRRLEFIASFDRDTRVNVAIRMSKNGSICAST